MFVPSVACAAIVNLPASPPCFRLRAHLHTHPNSLQLSRHHTLVRNHRRFLVLNLVLVLAGEHLTYLCRSAVDSIYSYETVTDLNYILTSDSDFAALSFSASLYLCLMLSVLCCAVLCCDSQPSNEPTLLPSAHPSNQPTALPSSRPSSHPSQQPSGRPSSKPSHKPTPVSRCPSWQTPPPLHLLLFLYLSCPCFLLYTTLTSQYSCL